MTRCYSPKSRILTPVAFFTALLSIVIAAIPVGAPAQHVGKGQAFVEDSATSVPLQARAPARAQGLPLSGTGAPTSNLMPRLEKSADAPTAGASARVSFNPAVPYDAGAPCVNSIAVADVNGDGRLDLLTANGCPVVNYQGQAGSVSVILGNGDGTFQPVVTYYSGGFEAVSVQVGDVNGDGNPDLLVANECSSALCPIGVIGVLLGNGDGTFQPAVTYNSDQPVSLAVADVNGDGKPDLVAAVICVSDCSGYRIGVLLGNGDGTFQPMATFFSGSLQEQSVMVSDVNGDGKPDVLVANACTDSFCTDGSVGVLLGNGDGTFQSPVAYSSGSPQTMSVAVADVNGDGRADLLVVNSCSSSTDCLTGSAGILLGDGNGTFGLPKTYDSGASAPFSLVVGDINGDGKPDLVIAHCTRGTKTGYSCPGGEGVIGLLLGNGDGTFQPSVTYGSGGVWARSVAIADVNGDGEPDLVVANGFGEPNGDGIVGVLLNQRPTTTTLVSSLNPSGVGLAVTFTATVSSNAGAPPNGETITFKSGSSVLGTVPLSGGSASLTTSSLAAGIYTITASYPGDTSYAASTSSGLRQVVTTKSATATALLSSLSPSIYGQTVTFTATVTTSGPVPPSGKVTFTWNGYTLGSAILNSSGVATFTKSNLNADTYPLQAVYAGDGSNLGSTSSVVSQVVTQATSSATLTSSPNPSTSGQPVTVTAAITSPTAKPTGPVTFSVGKTVLGTAELSGGKAKFITTTLAIGTTTVTATYYGDSNIAKSSASVAQTVH